MESNKDKENKKDMLNKTEKKEGENEGDGYDKNEEGNNDYKLNEFKEKIREIGDAPKTYVNKQACDEETDENDEQKEMNEVLRIMEEMVESNVKIKGTKRKNEILKKRIEDMERAIEKVNYIYKRGGEKYLTKSDKVLINIVMIYGEYSSRYTSNGSLIYKCVDMHKRTFKRWQWNVF